MTHQLPTLAEVSEALRVLQCLVPKLGYSKILLIQLDSDDVSVFLSSRWRRSDFFENNMSTETLIRCASLHSFYDNEDSLPAQLKKLASRSIYDVTIEKAKSLGLTDEEIQTLQKENN